MKAILVFGIGVAVGWLLTPRRVEYVPSGVVSVPSVWTDTEGTTTVSITTTGGEWYTICAN